MSEIPPYPERRPMVERCGPEDGPQRMPDGAMVIPLDSMMPGEILMLVNAGLQHLACLGDEELLRQTAAEAQPLWEQMKVVLRQPGYSVRHRLLCLQTMVASIQKGWERAEAASFEDFAPPA